MTDGQQGSRVFRFQTIESATAAARDGASTDHHRYFVVADAAAFGVVTVETLEALINHAAQDPGTQLTIMRVASPDGAVEPVDDPGDPEGRLVTFCTSG